MIFLKLFLTFLKIGAFTFGGGYAMLPLISEEVIRNAWITAPELIDFIAVSESTPGPFAINMATFVGMRTAGIFGALCATLGVVLPSFVIILLVAMSIEKFRQSKVVNGVMTGIKPAVIGMIGSALISVGRTVFFPAGLSTAVIMDMKFLLQAVVFAIAVVLAFHKIHPIKIIILSAVIGIAAGYAFGL